METLLDDVKGKIVDLKWNSHGIDNLIEVIIKMAEEIDELKSQIYLLRTTLNL